MSALAIARPHPLTARAVVHRDDPSLAALANGIGIPPSLASKADEGSGPDNVIAFPSLLAQAQALPLSPPGEHAESPDLRLPTPLEQAVIDLIGDRVGDPFSAEPPIDDEFSLEHDHVGDREVTDEHPAPTIDSAIEVTPILSEPTPTDRGPAASSRSPVSVTSAAMVAPQDRPSELPTSHVHLVIDDGAERVVMTVAVRGSDVNVALRTPDDPLAAALARNTSTLDHALRARGMSLAEFTAQRDRDPEPRRQPRHSESPRGRRPSVAPFTLAVLRGAS